MLRPGVDALSRSDARRVQPLAAGESLQCIELSAENTLIQLDTEDDTFADLERIERDAWLDSYVVAQEKAGSALQATSAVQGGAALTAMRAINFGLFNRAQGLGCEGPFSETDVTSAILWLREHCAPDWRFQLVPSSLPHDFEHRASAFGLSPKGRGPAKLYKEAADLSFPDPERETKLTVERVTSDSAAACIDVVKVTYGMPPAFASWGLGLVGRKDWHAYAAFDGSTPVAFGLMFVRGDWAWLGWGTTLVGHRGKGAQSALLKRRVADGMALGVEHYATECEAPSEHDHAASASHRNLIRAGFSEAYIRTAYGPA